MRDFVGRGMSVAAWSTFLGRRPVLPRMMLPFASPSRRGRDKLGDSAVRRRRACVRETPAKKSMNRIQQYWTASADSADRRWKSRRAAFSCFAGRRQPWHLFAPHALRGQLRLSAHRVAARRPTTTSGSSNGSCRFVSMRNYVAVSPRGNRHGRRPCRGSQAGRWLGPTPRRRGCRVGGYGWEQTKIIFCWPRIGFWKLSTASS